MIFKTLLKKHCKIGKSGVRGNWLLVSRERKGKLPVGRSGKRKVS
jgi:hypothetical protein